MNSQSPLVSIIVVNFNSGDRLARCVSALSKQTFRDFELIVIDNGSEDTSIEQAQAVSVPFVLIEAGDNLGFAAGNNRAAETATGEWLVFLNPDAYAATDWLSSLVDAAKRYPSVDAFGSTQIDAGDPQLLDGAGDAYHAFGIPYRGHFGWPVETLPQEGECFAPCAAAAMYRRTVFEMLGGFEESFFCYGEDVDLGFRLRLAGGRAVQVPSACVHHEGSGISGRRSDFTMYHGHRNRVWTFYRNMPFALLIFLTPFHMAANFYLLLRFTFTGEAGVYLRAMRDGFGNLASQSDSRRKIQQRRKVRLGQLCAALTWSPLKPFRRKADIKPVWPYSN